MDQFQQWLWLQLSIHIWCMASNWWGCEQVTEVSQKLGPALQLSHSGQQHHVCLAAGQCRIWWCHSSRLVGEWPSQPLPSVLLSPSLYALQVGQMELQEERMNMTLPIKPCGRIKSRIISCHIHKAQYIARYMYKQQTIVYTLKTFGLKQSDHLSLSTNYWAILHSFLLKNICTILYSVESIY